MGRADAAAPLRLLSVLRLVTASLLSILTIRRRLSLVAVRDHLLSLLFLLCGLRPAAVRIHDADGTSVVHVWGPPRRRRGKPALVLVHGFGGNAKWQWVQQIRPLSRSFDLFIPDLIFFGRSVSDCSHRSVAFQARCVGEAMRRLGVGSYSLCGISYGGYVAYRMAAVEAAAEVERVIIMTAGVGTTTAELKQLADQEGQDVAEILLPCRPEDLMALMRRSMYRAPLWMPEFLLNDFIQMMYINHRKERLELLKELLQNGLDLDPLPVLTQETLILWGDRDTIFPAHLAHKLQRHLGEKAKLEIIKDAGHALQLEQSEQVNQLITWYLQGVNN